VGLRDSFARLPLTDRVTFAIELWSAIFYGAFTGLALPLITVVARKIGMTAEAINAMVTVQFIAALFGIYMGHLAKRSTVMFFSVWPPLLSRVAIGALAFVRTPGPYLAVTAAFYFLSSLNGPAYSSFLRSNYSDAHRSRIMGDIRIAVTVLSAIFSGIAGLVLARNEALMRWLFLLSAGFGVASSLVFSRIKIRRRPDDPLEEAPRPTLRQSVRTVRKNLPFLGFVGLFFLCAGFDKLAVPLEPIWLVDTLRISYSDTSFMLGTVISLASIAAYFLWARALRRFNPFTLLAVNVVAFSARFAALAAARSSAQLLPMSIFSGICNAGWDIIPIFCMIALTDSENFALYIGVNTTLYGVRGLIGPTVGTLLYTSKAMSLDAILWMISGLLLASAVGMFVFARTTGRRALEAQRARKGSTAAA
jgi:hypothetical protein